MLPSRRNGRVVWAGCCDTSTGGHLGSGAGPRRPRSRAQRRSPEAPTDGALGLGRAARPGTGVALHGGRALAVPGEDGLTGQACWTRRAPGSPAPTHQACSPLSPEGGATLSDTPAPQDGSGVCQRDARAGARRPNTPARSDPQPATAPTGPQTAGSRPGRGGPRGAGRRRREGHRWTLPTWNRTPGRRARARAGLGPAVGAESLAVCARTSACQGDP